MSTCRATKANPSLPYPWTCTRPANHTGDHTARGIGGVVLKRWRRRVSLR